MPRPRASRRGSPRRSHSPASWFRSAGPPAPAEPQRRDALHIGPWTTRRTARARRAPRRRTRATCGSSWRQIHSTCALDTALATWSAIRCAAATRWPPFARSWSSRARSRYAQRLTQADFVLLAGDLFHDNKPSRPTMYKTMALLREYTMGDDPVTMELLSDPYTPGAPAAFPSINYEDANLNVSMPVFCIHGNHDDPQGVGEDGSLSALDVLSAAGLLNYFGQVRLPSASHTRKRRADDAADGLIPLRPILLRKGDTRIALYGLGNLKDERLTHELRERHVCMYRPAEDTDAWFNILALHQNRYVARLTQCAAQYPRLRPGEHARRLAAPRSVGPRARAAHPARGRGREELLHLAAGQHRGDKPVARRARAEVRRDRDGARPRLSDRVRAADHRASVCDARHGPHRGRRGRPGGRDRPRGGHQAAAQPGTPAC